MKRNRGEQIRSAADRDDQAISNQQRAIPVKIEPLRQFIVKMNRILGLEMGALGVRLITDRQMTRLNHTYRNKKKTTDVLSFPAHRRSRPRRAWRAPRKRSSGYVGDIAISPGVARRNARVFGRTLDGELRVLILHGALHLLGYDHEVDNGEMERVEMKLRRRLGIP
jgi:probable rRNA maturation factor